MPREFKRADRVADALQRALATLIRHEVNDPRLGMVNINAVKVANDLAYAKIYVTFVGNNDRNTAQDSVDILNHAANYLRNLAGKELTMRSVPRLQFIFDDAAIRGHEISSLIDRAVAKDRASRDNS